MKQFFDSGPHHVQRVEVYAIPLAVITLTSPVDTTMYRNIEPVIEETYRETIEAAKSQALDQFHEDSCTGCPLKPGCEITPNLDFEAMRSVAVPRGVTFPGGHEEEMGAVFPVIAVTGRVTIDVDLPHRSLSDALGFVAEHAFCCSGMPVEDLGDGRGTIGPHNCNICGIER